MSLLLTMLVLMCYDNDIGDDNEVLTAYVGDDEYFYEIVEK